MHNFLQRLIDDLVDFLELSVIVNASLSYIYYQMKWIGDLDMKKNRFVRQNLFCFFLKIVMSDFN